MSKNMPWFKFYSDEWLTGDVTLEDFDIQGLFISVCAYYWKQGCSTTMAKLLKRYRHANKMQWQILMDSSLIKVNDDVISISFLDEQLNEFGDNHDKKSLAGRKGAEKRWKNSSAIVVPMAKHGNIELDKEVDKEVDKDKELDKETNTTDSFESVVIVVDDFQFDEFWNRYGKKVDPKKCRAKWMKLKQIERDMAMSKVDAYVKSTPDIKYRKNPLSWLNAAGWESEIIVPKTPQEQQIENLINWSESRGEKIDSFKDLFGEGF